MTMTIEQLKGMKVAELRTLAVAEGVVYWNAAEKRKMNKGEIVRALTSHFGAKEVAEVVEVVEIQVVAPATVEVVQAEVIEQVIEPVQVIEVVDAVQTVQVTETAPDFATMTPTEVVKYVKAQAATMDVQALKQLVTQVLEANTHKLTDRRNKLLVRTWSNIKNQLHALIKIASKRKLAH